MTKLRHWDNLGTARFVTFGCYLRKPYLEHSGAKRLLVEEIAHARTKHKFSIVGYVLMPEHVHLVLFPPDGMTLGLVIREIKSRMARRYFAQSQVAPPIPHACSGNVGAMITIAGQWRPFGRKFGIVIRTRSSVDW